MMPGHRPASWLAPTTGNAPSDMPRKLWHLGIHPAPRTATSIPVHVSDRKSCSLYHTSNMTGLPCALATGLSQPVLIYPQSRGWQDCYQDLDHCAVCDRTRQNIGVLRCLLPVPPVLGQPGRPLIYRGYKPVSEALRIRAADLNTAYLPESGTTPDGMTDVSTGLPQATHHWYLSTLSWSCRLWPTSLSSALVPGHRGEAARHSSDVSVPICCCRTPAWCPSANCPTQAASTAGSSMQFVGLKVPLELEIEV